MSIGQAKVISFINLKGGVAKTTSAVNVAASIAKYCVAGSSSQRKPAKVLLIDLDPQSNASLSILDRTQYDEENTVVKLFEYHLESSSQSTDFPIHKILYSQPIEGLNLDLIPSSLNLFDIQDRLAQYHSHYISATDLLVNALDRLRKQIDIVYTHIIIDCPPSLGLVTLNGICCSDYYIVPTLLDSYSYWGLSKIIERVNQLKAVKSSCNAELLGVLYSRVDATAKSQNKYWSDEFDKWEIENLKQFKSLYKKGHKSVVFTERILSADIIRKAETAHRPVVAYKPLDSNEKMAMEKCQKQWLSLVREIIDRI